MKKLKSLIPQKKNAALYVATLLIILPICLHLFTADKYALVRKSDGKYFYAKKILVIGNSMISFSSETISGKKTGNFIPDDIEYSFAVSSLDTIQSITFKDNIPDADLNTNKKYLGKYTITVQGHRGTLMLYIKDNKLYGYVKFPSWGKGAYEYLKSLSIKNGRIFFVRSANTAKEMTRLGANRFFTQKFSGEYNNNGKKIDGFFRNDLGEKHIWDAKRR